VNLNRPDPVQSQDPETPDEEFEKLRQHFHQRLGKEQTRLSALAQAHESGHLASASTLVDIREFAHRLRGAALVFGFQALGDCAAAVELAAIAASLEANVRGCSQAVTATMRALAIKLTNEIGMGGSSGPVTQQCGTGLPHS
jgi:HPt (histidine-containing phosphotransfer) domain-containing protein